MFLAELAYNTVAKEIKELEDKQSRRDKSLLDSKKELEDDKMDLQHYIGKDKQMRERKEKQEKDLQTERSLKEDRLKKLDQNISQVKSEIEKNKDALNSLKENRDFILELSDKEFLDNRKAQYKFKQEKLMNEWIAAHKRDPTLDYDIIFKDDEEIHDFEKMNFSFMKEKPSQGAGVSMADGRGNRNVRPGTEHELMTDEDWKARFHQLMKLHLIDVPPNYYDDQLFFKRPEELKSIFQKLEEENLSQIHHL